MKPCFDLTGKKIGRWNVIAQADPPPNITANRHKSFWYCECECGFTSIVVGSNLRRGTSKSCGCGQLVRDSFGRFLK